MSTPGALLVLARLRRLSKLYIFEEDGGGGQTGGRVAEVRGEVGWERTWLGLWGPGRWWSEYTLYSIVLHEHLLFDALHVTRGECKRGRGGLAG